MAPRPPARAGCRLQGVLVGLPSRRPPPSTLRLHAPPHPPAPTPQQVRFVVLDEADQMLNVGFEKDVENILENVPEVRSAAQVAGGAGTRRALQAAPQRAVEQCRAVPPAAFTRVLAYTTICCSPSLPSPAC